MGDADQSDEDLELRKIDREYDRKEAEAQNAHVREMAKLAQEHGNAIALEAAKADAQLRNDRIKAVGAADDELNKLFHQTVAEATSAGFDRARDSAKFVQTAATAIFAVYTALLGLVYSVTDNPLPLRGAWAGVFLGLAIAFATAYLTFLTGSKKVEIKLNRRDRLRIQYSRTANLTRWVSQSVQRRAYAARAAVLSLAFGVLFIAAPFVATAVPAATPPVPTPPVVPSEMGAAFTAPAVDVFRAQVTEYKRALAARNAALDSAKIAAEDRAAAESKLNWVAAVLAAVALLGVFIGALFPRDKTDDSTDSASGPSAQGAAGRQPPDGGS